MRAKASTHSICLICVSTDDRRVDVPAALTGTRWTDKFAALEFIEFHAVNDEET